MVHVLAVQWESGLPWKTHGSRELELALLEEAQMGDNIFAPEGIATFRLCSACEAATGRGEEDYAT